MLLATASMAMESLSTGFQGYLLFVGNRVNNPLFHDMEQASDLYSSARRLEGGL